MVQISTARLRVPPMYAVMTGETGKAIVLGALTAPFFATAPRSIIAATTTSQDAQILPLEVFGTTCMTAHLPEPGATDQAILETPY